MVHLQKFTYVSNIIFNLSKYQFYKFHYYTKKFLRYLKIGLNDLTYRNCLPEYMQ